MKKAVSIFILLCFGCTHQPNKKNIAISLSDSNRTVQIKGFDKAVIADIGRDTANSPWQSLLPVYKMPADTDLKDFQNPQPGKYQVRDSVIVFTPDTSFKKGQVYFLRSYQFDKSGDAWHYIRDKKRPGDLRYKDLIFSY